MKYLFIFLPFLAFGQTIPCGDTLINWRSFKKDSARIVSLDTCWEIKNGWMSLKPGCTPYFNTLGSIEYSPEFNKQGLYVSDRKPKVVESFKHGGAYYELRDNGWYKEILPDTIPRIEYYDYKEGAVKIKGDSVFQWAEESKWISCDQHIGIREMPKRDKIDRNKARILVWNGCSTVELNVFKNTHYNEMTVAKNVGNLAVYISETIRVDVVSEYLSEQGWIKPSHVIKEL